MTQDFIGSIVKKTKRYLTKALLDDGMDGEKYEPAPVAVTNSILGATQSFSGLLPYDMYDPASGLFFNNGTFGYIFEFVPQTGANDQMASSLQALYTSAPADIGIQIVLTAMPDMDPLLRRYIELREQGADRGEPNTELYVELARNHARHIRRGSIEPLWPGDLFSIKNYRVLFSVVKEGSTDDLETISHMQTMRDSYRQIMRTAGFPTVDVDAEHFINWLYPIVNAQRMFSWDELPWLNYDDGKRISAQVRDPSLIRQRFDHLLFGQGKDVVEARTYSVMNYPRKMELYEMGSLVGDFFNGALQYPCPFMIQMGVATRDFDTVKNTSMMKAARAQQNADSQMAKFQPALTEIQKDWKVVMHRLDEGHTMCELYHTLTLFCPPERMEAAESAALAVWRSKGFTLVRDYLTQLATFYTSLPMTLSPNVRDDLSKFERISTKTTDNAIHLAPIIGEWKGVGEEVMMMVGRRGQPTFLDFYANSQGNYNVAVTGVSGSGKSVLMQYIMQSYRSIGARGWIIDVGRSYEKLVDVNGGQFIEFRTDEPICINPYTWTTSLKEDMKLLKPWIGKMAQASGPYAMSLIEQAAGRCFEDHRQAANITHVQKYLMTKCRTPNGQIDEEAYRLGVQLTPFCDNGMYADFFNGAATVDMRADLVALEMEELKGAPELLQAVLFVVMYRITFEMYLSRTTRKVSLLDEAWQMLGDGSESADFLEEGYRRARKYDGCFISGTQGVGDYFKNPASRAAYTNADWKLYLRQDEDTLKELKHNGQLNLDPVLERMIASLQTESGKYSEFVIRSPMGSGLNRLILDPYFIEMSSTKAEDFTAFHDLRSRGLSTKNAIYELMRRKGYSNV